MVYNHMSTQFKLRVTREGRQVDEKNVQVGNMNKWSSLEVSRFGRRGQKSPRPRGAQAAFHRFPTPPSGSLLAIERFANR